MTSDPRTLPSFNAPCKLCGAPVEAEKELDPAPNGAPQVRIFFECGGEVTLQLVGNPNNRGSRFWRRRTRPVCGARDPEENLL